MGTISSMKGELDVDNQLLFIALIAFFIAAFLKGLTGLGFMTICLGILALFIDLKVAIPLLFIPSLCSNILVMIQAGGFLTALKRFWPLYLSAFPGLLIGLFLLGSQGDEIPKYILAVVMILYGIYGLRKGMFSLSYSLEKKYMIPVGVVSGFVNGATGSQIMPIMPYLLALKMSKDLFVQTINCAFTLNTIIMIIGVGKLGLLTQTKVFVSIIGVLPVFLGIYLGGQIRKQLSDARFKKLVLILLIVLGGILIVRISI